MAAKPKTTARNGIATRVNQDGSKSYRWEISRRKERGGNLRGPWTSSNAEARSGRTKALGELSTGTIAKAQPTTLREAWAEFLAAAQTGAAVSRSGKPFKPSTLRGYQRGWEKIAPELGARKLTEIRRADVQAMVDRWAAKGAFDKNKKRKRISPSTIRNSLDPLRVIYRRAIRREVVFVNPTDGLEIPADHDAEPMRFASREELQTLVGALPSAERALWATAAYGGLRRGELRALRWDDVDLAAGLIHVTRSWDDKAGEQTPKTKGSNRKVPVVPTLADQLRAHQRETKRTGRDLVFGRTAADSFIPSTIRNRALAAWKKADVQPIGLHQCRHSFASLMIAAGCNAKALSVVMGHASISITFDRYGHLMPGGEVEVGRLLAQYLEQN